MNLVHNRGVYITAHAKNPLETKRARFKGARKEHLFLTSVIRECKMQGTINPVSDYIVVKRVMAEEVVNHRIGQANAESRHEVAGPMVVGHAFFFDDLSQQHCNMPRNQTKSTDNS